MCLMIYKVIHGTCFHTLENVQPPQFQFYYMFMTYSKWSFWVWFNGTQSWPKLSFFRDFVNQAAKLKNTYKCISKPVKQHSSEI